MHSGPRWPGLVLTQCACRLPSALAATLIFFMQAGFAMLEAGIVHPKNSTNILFKNMIDAALAALIFWLVGYGVAYGPTAGSDGFIGTFNFAIGIDGASNIKNGATVTQGGPRTFSDGWEMWFIQWAFAAKSVSIVAGSVAERTRPRAYFIYSCVFTMLIYPVVAHWVWGQGFLSPWGARPDADGKARPIFSKTSDSNGVIDFAGCGVVHMVGGFTGLVGAIIVGPRTGRFMDGKVNDLYSGNKTLQALGTFILWFGWYGFNAGSTLGLGGNLANVAGKVVVNTTMAGAVAGVVVTFFSRWYLGHYCISMGLNGVLAGLVSITASCHVVEPWHAIIIGTVAAILLFFGSILLQKMKIDDPCDACIVHGVVGTWGLWAVGIFCIDSNVQYAAYPNVNTACKSGEQFGVQIVGSLAIFAWTVGTSAIMFLAIKYTVGLRITAEAEDMGLDASEHGIAWDNTEEDLSKPPPSQAAHPLQPAMMAQAPYGVQMTQQPQFSFVPQNGFPQAPNGFQNY
jgi:ammonium transporter, Amt family